MIKHKRRFHRLRNIQMAIERKMGFTVLELLIVIAIIGILVAIIFPYLARSKEKARDVERLSDIKEIRVGLEQYYMRYGRYPCYSLWATTLNGPEMNTYDSSLFPSFLNDAPTSSEQPYCPSGGGNGLVNDGIMSSVPMDPINLSVSGKGYGYAYEAPNNSRVGPQTYVLYTRLENNTALMENDGGFCDTIYEVGPGVGTVKLAASVNYFDSSRFSCP